ncbi:YebO family protein [Shigella flexneri]
MQRSCKFRRDEHCALVVLVVVLLIGAHLVVFYQSCQFGLTNRLNCLRRCWIQQKRQTALLRRLCEANEPEKADKRDR